MNPSSQRGRRTLWMAALMVAVGGGAALFLLRGAADAPRTGPAPRPPAADRSPAPAAPAAIAPTPHDPGPHSAPAPVQAPAVATPTVVSSPPDMPPPSVVSTVDKNPEIEPERPQTPEWKLEKREQIAESMGERLVRLEQEVRDAEARGDPKSAASLRVLLDRSRRRVAELQREIASMREQLRSGAGTAPAGGG